MKDGDRVVCMYYEIENPSGKRPAQPRQGTIIRTKERIGGMGKGYCHLIKWDDGEEATQFEGYLRIITPLEHLL